MVGRWEGTGKGSYPGTEDFDFGQQIDFAHNGGNYLHYLSQTFEVDEQGLAIRPLTMETGFWRPQRDGSIEVVMCHPDGYAEVWYGKITGARIELATDAVVRTARPTTTRPVSGCTAMSRATCSGPSTRPPRAPAADLHLGPAPPRLRAEAEYAPRPAVSLLRHDCDDGKKRVDRSC